MLQHDPCFADITQPPSDVSIEAAHYQPTNAIRSRGVQSGPLNLLSQNRRNRVGGVLALKGAPPRQHLVEHGAEGPNVTPPVGFLATRLFWTEVGRCAEYDAARNQGRTGECR